MSSGVKVSSGRLRVDAARAVGKLREYQLPDSSAWVLEVIRAAVAFGASEVRVSGDADDVRVAWDGPAPDAESLAHLFDELVDPAPRIERRPVRLLATGVNTALGLEPRWVDVTVTDGSGSATSVRYSPKLFELRDGAAEGLRALRPETRRAGPHAPRAGGLVHLRRLPSIGAVPLMIGYGEPRELAVARRSCDDSTVPVIVGKTELGRGHSHGDLIRLPLGHELDGFVAVVDPAHAGPQVELEVAELGVTLARYGLTLVAFPTPRAHMPLRIYIDAPRMPSNASRSAVRLEESPVSDAIARGKALVPDLVARLATELGEQPEHAWTPGQRERLRAAALTLCAAHVAGMKWRQYVRSAPATLTKLLALPLVRDALGRPRSLDSFGAAIGAELVHFGPDPLDRELEQWLGDTLWVPPGDPTSALLGSWAPADTSALVRTVRRYRRRRSAFSQVAEREPEVEPDPMHLLVVPIRAPGRSLKSCVPEELFDVKGLRGEIALRDASTPEDGVSMLFDGRAITRWSLVRLVEGAATCADLVPQVDYSGLVENDAVRALRGAVRGAVVVAYEALALRWRGKASKGDRARSVAHWVGGASGDEGARIASVLRRGVLFTMQLHADRSVDVDPQSRRDAGRRALLDSRSPLVSAAIWPKVGGGYATTAELFAQGDAPPHVIGYFIGSRVPGSAPAGRPLFALRQEDLTGLRSFLPSARFIDYARALLRPRRSTESGALARSIMAPLGAGLEFEPTPGLRVAVTWGSNASSMIEVRHWGLLLEEQELPELIPAARIVVEDPALVPDASFRHAVDQPEYPVRFWNHRLARALVDALGGKQVSGLFLGQPDAIDARGAQTALLEWIAGTDEAKQVLGKTRFRRLRDVAFVRRLGQVGYATLAELGDGAIEWLPLSQADAVDLGDWHPVCADESSVMAFAKILGRDTSNVLPRLALRRRAVRRKHALSRHRARPPVDPVARWKDTKVEFKGKGIRAAAATFGQRPSGADVELLIESRPFRELRVDDAFPLRLVLDLPPSAADEDFAEVSDLGHRRIRAAIGAGARKLLDTTARNSPTSLTGAPNVYALLLAWSARVTLEGGNSEDRKTLERLAAAPAFLTIQGAHVPLADATTGGGTVRVARWEERWLGDDGDRPVLRLPTRDADAYRALLCALTPGGTHKTRDVTTQVARTQAKRRVERGLMQAPRLVGEYDPRFRYDLSELLDETEHAEALGALGIGEVALSRSPESKVTYAREGRTATLSLALVPAVHVAAQVPIVEAGMRSAASMRKPLRAAVGTLISLVVRRAIDDTPPDQLPRWLREVLRDASLAGGALHLTRLEDTPFFETSVGTYVSPAEALGQATRFGAVWTTDSKQELRSLDPARIALRLDFEQTQQLSDYAKAVVATEELLDDCEARRNQARPPVTTLEPSAAASGAALRTVTLEPTEHASHGSIVLLRPGYESLRGVRVSRSFHPLGDLPDAETIWPVACWIDDPGLTPNRTWSEPVDDVVLVGLMSRVASAVYGAVTELTPIPQSKLAATRVISAKDLPLPAGACVMGVVWLEDEPAPGSLRLSDAKGERTEASVDLAGEPLPLHGELRVTAPLGDVRVRKLCVELYRRLLVQLTMVVEGRRGPRRDQTFDHLTHALRADVAPAGWHRSQITSALLPDKILRRVSVAGFVGDGPSTLAELREHLACQGVVAVCAPADRAEAEGAALDAPLFVHDGSAAARSSLSLIADRAKPWRSVLRVEVDLTPPVFASTEPVRQRPRHPLAEAVLKRWRTLALPGIEDVRLDGRRKNPPIRWDHFTHIVLSKRHPAVRCAVEAIEGKSVDASSHVALLVAHAAGMRRRAGGNPSASAERAMLRELMRELAMQ